MGGSLMNIDVKLPEATRTIELSDGSNAFDLLKELGLYPDAVLVFRDGKVLPEDECLENGDRIEIMKIASGG